MRLLKVKCVEEAGQSEIQTIAYNDHMKIIASASQNEAVILRKNPNFSVYKRISHFPKFQCSNDQISYDLNSIQQFQSPNQVIDAPQRSISATKILFSSSNELVVGYQNGDVLIFNSHTMEKISEFNFGSEITNLQYVGNNIRLFLSTIEGEMILLDSTTWQILEQKQLNIIFSKDIIISNDLATIYTIIDAKRVASYDFSTLHQQKIFKGHKSGINMIRLSPDGLLLASSGNDHKICLFDTVSGELHSLLLGHTDEVYAICFSPDGRFLISSSEDMSLRIWDVHSYECLKVMHDVPNAMDITMVGEILFMGNVNSEIRMFRIF